MLLVNSTMQSPVAETGPVVFDDETRERVAAADYDVDYVEQNADVETDLEKDPIDRPHKITSTGLLKNKMWIDSARTLYAMFRDSANTRILPFQQSQEFSTEENMTYKPTSEEISDEDIGEWGLELMGRFNWHLPEMAMMAYNIQGAPLQHRIAFYNMMQTYDKLPDFTWDGSWRMIRGLGTDLSSWIGLGTLGAGFLAKQAAKEAGKKGLMSALRATLPAGILTGIEGSAYASVDDASRQYVKLASPTSGQKKYDITRTAATAGAGFVIGGASGTAAPIAIPAVVRGAYRGFNDIVKAAQSNTFFSGIPTSGGSNKGPTSATRATGAKRGVRKKKAYRFKAGEREKLNAIAEQANLKAAEVEAEYKRLKAQYPESAGWAPFEVESAKKVKGKIQLEVKKQPYDFHNKGNIDTLSNKMVSEVLRLKQRVSDGDPVAKAIWEHRTWYSEMRQRMRAEFGAFGDVFTDVIATTSAQTNVQQNWENAIEVMHRFTRGEFDDVLTKLDVWLNSVDANGNPRKLGSGKPENDGYVDHHYRVKNEAEKAALEQGHSEKEAKEIAFEAAQAEFPLIGKRSGALFNTNSPQTMMALLGLFRDIVPGSSPKTFNFASNIIGFPAFGEKQRSTIDVWAARNLRRLAGLKRVPVAAEQAVSGDILKTTMQPGGEFGFGQDVYAEAANKLRQQGIDLNDDDLQAVVWFMEKEIWTENGWTTRAGEEGSLETEADFAGVWNPEGVKAARSTLSSDSDAAARRKIEEDLSSPERKAVYDEAVAAKKELAEFIEAGTQAKRRNYIMQSEGIEDKNVAMERVKEINAQLTVYNREIKKYEALQPRLDKKVKKREGEVAEAEQVLERKVPARRFIGGISLQEGQTKIPKDPDMNEAQGRVLNTVNPDPTVLMAKATPSVGRYIDPSGKKWDERTIDFEYVARENHDPEDAKRQLVQEAKDSNQESAFFSEVVKPGTVDGANPGFEIYFNRKLNKREVLNLTKIINKLDLDVGFTFATDLRFAERQAGGTELADNYVGLRMQYIPEFGGGQEGSSAVTDRVLSLIDLLKNKLDYVSTARYTEYNTQVWFRDSGDYDAFLTGNL